MPAGGLSNKGIIYRPLIGGWSIPIQAEKAERSAQKADEKALKDHSKAVEAEHKASKELERAQAKHDQGRRYQIR